jgi:hypothetical protein
VRGEERRVSVNQALALLNVPFVSIALIDEGRIAFARADGKYATPDTLYQAASLSKFVAAIGATRLSRAAAAPAPITVLRFRAAPTLFRRRL